MAGEQDQPSQDTRSIDLVIRITHDKGQIKAECLPTLHRFLIDELPRAGFHAVRAVVNSIFDAIEKGPTDV